MCSVLFHSVPFITQVYDSSGNLLGYEITCHSYGYGFLDVETMSQVLYAESVMDLFPWKLWTADGNQTPGTEMIIPILESVLKRSPNHLGANHFYVHALESSPHPEKALASAMLLPKLAPNSPHLVHMPSHIFIHTGDYFATVQTNIAAAALGDAHWGRKYRKPFALA
jgi:hypothetical protein